MSALVYLLAAAVTGRTIVAWLLLEAQLEPDFGLLLSGPALFPSPGGTLLGYLLGGHGLAALNAIAAGGLVLAAAALARRHGCRPTRAALFVALSPVGLWTLFAGVDAIAALLLTAALLARSGRLATIAATAAVLVHLAALVPVGAYLLATAQRGSRRSNASLPIVGLLGVAGIALALLTPYTAAVERLGEPGFILAGLIALAGSLLLFAPWLGRAWSVATLRPALIAGAAATVIPAGVMATGPLDLTASAWRYSLPLAIALSAGAGR